MVGLASRTQGWPFAPEVNSSHEDRGATLDARRASSGALIRWHVSSKLGRGPFHKRSPTDSNTGTSSRSVAKVRNSNASSHALNRDSDKVRAFLIEGCHACQSLGISSRCEYCDKTRAAPFNPHPATPG